MQNTNVYNSNCSSPYVTKAVSRRHCFLSIRARFIFLDRGGGQRLVPRESGADGRRALRPSPVSALPGEDREITRTGGEGDGGGRPSSANGDREMATSSDDKHKVNGGC